MFLYAIKIVKGIKDVALDENQLHETTSKTIGGVR